MEQFFFSFKQYMRSAFSDSTELIIALGSLVLLYILILALLSFSKKPTTTLRIFRMAYLSSFIVLTVLLIVVISIWNFSDFFVRRDIQFVFFLTELMLLIIPLILLIKLSSHFTKDKLHKLSGISYSILERDKFYHNSKKEYNKIKFFFLLPALAFFLLLIQNPNPTLLSFVVDNSSSMSDFASVKEAIANPLYRVDDNIVITVSHFENCSSDLECMQLSQQLKSEIGDIVTTDYFDDLRGTIEYFSNKTSAIEYFAYDIDPEIVGGTPLIECIWKTFLFRKESMFSRSFKKKILVVATDGVGNLTDQSFGNTSGNFSVFTHLSVNEEETIIDYYDDVALINFGSSGSGGFWYSLNSSHIFDGQSPASIEAAMREITIDMRIDWNFILLLAIPYGLIMLILLFVVPKKL